jgi:general nucleoside transport system permease protein
LRQSIHKAYQKAMVPIVSALLALALGIFIIMLTGNDPLEAYQYMFGGMFGSFNNFSELLVSAIPFIFTGLAIAFAYKSGVYTIGVDGQLIMGAMAASLFADTFSTLNGYVIMVGAIACGMAAGALWGAIAGALKAYRKVNEIVSTLIMNYIALFFAQYLYSGPLEAKSSRIPQTEKIIEKAHLPILFDGTRLHSGLFIAILSVILVYYILYHTSLGVKFRAVGINGVASQYNGIGVKQYTTVAMAISGAIGGLAGTVELLGTQFKIMDGFCANFGFDGIAIALIGQLHPIGVAFAALFFAGLDVGSNSMELMTNVPSSIADILQGIIIIFVVSGSVLVREQNWKRLSKFRIKKMPGNLKGEKTGV